jgi:hypothetical protein
MASTIAVIRIRNQRKISEEETNEESLLETLVSKIPSEETWDAEFFLGMLVAG